MKMVTLIIMMMVRPLRQTSLLIFKHQRFAFQRQPHKMVRHIQTIRRQKPMFTADLVTFTEEILNGKLHFFAANSLNIRNKFCNEPAPTENEKPLSIYDLTIYIYIYIYRLHTKSIFPVIFRKTSYCSVFSLKTSSTKIR